MIEMSIRGGEQRDKEKNMKSYLGKGKVFAESQLI